MLLVNLFILFAKINLKISCDNNKNLKVKLQLNNSKIRNPLTKDSARRQESGIQHQAEVASGNQQKQKRHRNSALDMGHWNRAGHKGHPQRLTGSRTLTPETQGTPRWAGGGKTLHSAFSSRYCVSSHIPESVSQDTPRIH